MIGPYQTALTIRARLFRVLLPSGLLGMHSQWSSLLRQFRKLQCLMQSSRFTTLRVKQWCLLYRRCSYRLRLQGMQCCKAACLRHVPDIISCIMLPYLILKHGGFASHCQSAMLRPHLFVIRETLQVFSSHSLGYACNCLTMLSSYVFPVYIVLLIHIDISARRGLITCLPMWHIIFASCACR